MCLYLTGKKRVRDSRTDCHLCFVLSCAEEVPYITSNGPKLVDAAEGSVVVLQCEVRAAPAAVITWHKDG